MRYYEKKYKTFIFIFLKAKQIKEALIKYLLLEELKKKKKKLLIIKKKCLNFIFFFYAIL